MRLLYSVAGHPTGPMSEEQLSQEQLSELYRHPLPTGRSAWLRTNFVTSLDGSIQGPDGRSGSINTVSDQHVFALHRAHADAVVVGAETARAEGYRAVDLAPWQRELRRQEGLSGFPVLAVVTRSLNVDPGVVANGTLEVGPVLVLTTAGKTQAQLAPFADAGVEVLQLPGEQGVDLRAAVDGLAGRGCRRLLCEGGSRLHRDLLAEDLVDEMSLTLAPIAVGGEGRRTTVGDALPDPPAFHLGSALLGDDGAVFVNYVRDGREPG